MSDIVKSMKLKKFNNFPLVWFIILMYRNGPIPFKKIPLLIFYYSNIILSMPLLLVRNLLLKRKIESVEFIEDPVFILGHFRSGTTYLHKLLLADNNFGYLTIYDFLFPNLSLFTGKKTKKFLQAVINKLRIKNFHFNNYSFQLNDPGEEDLFMANIPSRFTSCWGFIFPQKWKDWLNPNFDKLNFDDNWHRHYYKILQELAIKTKGKRLLLKNPPNTGRIPILLKLFPDAKFIYIDRNPYHLYYSLQHLWKKVICKYYSLQELDDEFIDEIIFDHFTSIKEKYDNDKYLIPKGNLIEIAFEDLEAFPFEVVKNIYSELNIRGFSKMENELKRIVEREKKYKKFEHKYSSEKNTMIERYWGKFVCDRNYACPERIV